MQIFSFDSSPAVATAVGATLNVSAEQAARARIGVNGPMLQAALVQAAAYNGLAADSVPTDRGYFLAQQLEQINEQARELKRPELNALKLFPIDGSIGAGAVSYTQRRKQGGARVDYYRGPGKAPAAAYVETWEEKYEIHTAVTGMKYNVFDLMHADFAGLDLRGDLRRAMTVGVDEFLNAKAWNGDVENGVLGVLNNIFCSRRFSATTWGTATPGDTILNDLQASYDLMGERSKNVFIGNKCAISIRLRNVLKRKRNTSESETIMEAFLKANPELSEDTFVAVHELDGAGPSGQDIFFWYRDGGAEGRASVSHVLPRGLTLLPAQQQGFEVIIPGYLRHGGIRMDDPLYNLINYVPRA